MESYLHGPMIAVKLNYDFNATGLNWNCDVIRQDLTEWDTLKSKQKWNHLKKKVLFFDDK